MELYKMLQLLNDKDNRLGGVEQVTFKLGSRTLTLNHRELSTDGKAVTIYLQVENKEPPSD